MKKLGIVLVGVVSSLLFGANVYAQPYASVNVETLNLRQAPTQEATITNTYNKDDTVKIIDEALPGWYSVENSAGQTAYVKSEYVDVFKVKAVINANGVNVRTAPTQDSTINRQFDKGQDISVHYQVGDWYYISLGTEPFFGFAHKKYIDSSFLNLVQSKNISEIKQDEVTAPKVTQTSKADSVISYAKQFLGNRYVFGGTSLTKGIDCSAFTQQIMKKVGVSIQRSSAAQYASNGVKVSTNNLQPGDLLFYGYGGRVSHVGIYIGNKKMIHASSSTTGIIISNAFRTSGKPLIGAKRVL